MARYLQTIEVKGQGNFPFDMLRYDQCWPRDSDDVLEMTKYSSRIVFLNRVVERKDIEPTKDRWASFGWTVRGFKMLKL